MSQNPHRYVCECPYRSCRERITLTPARYSELARFGCVVSPYCTSGRTVLLAEPGVRVVATTRLEEFA